jgi:translation initiation factor 2B subunit (eIF-2B alpha/beta/delta family)
MPKNKETNPAQPLLETSMKALYAAAGLTDLLTERFKEYAEAYQEEARSRRAKTLEQINQATERAQEQFTHATKQAQEMMRHTQEMAFSAPTMARNFPDQVQEQLEELLKELNLTFEEMVRRGEARLAAFRGSAAGAMRDTAETVEEAVNEAADDAAEAVQEAADRVDPEGAPEPDMVSEASPEVVESVQGEAIDEEAAAASEAARAQAEVEDEPKVTAKKAPARKTAKKAPAKKAAAKKTAAEPEVETPAPGDTPAP